MTYGSSPPGRHAARRPSAATRVRRPGSRLLPSVAAPESNDEEVSCPVLTLTDNAAELVKSIAEASPELPDDSGLRIQGEASEEHGLALQLSMTSAPDEGDEVIEEAGARIFV